MLTDPNRFLPRRRVVKIGAALAAPLLAAAVGVRLRGDRRAAARQATEPATGTPSLPPTPACADEDDLLETPEQAAGPFYTRDSPERVSLLEEGLPGTRLVVRGHVLSTGCRPVPGALLDFWQADDAGAYDNLGYTLRGHQFAGEDGRFELETIVPGLYPGRTRHIHVRAQAAEGPVLTTQLYFPDEPANERDGLFDPALLVAFENADDGDGRLARFDFVLDAD